MVLKKNELAKTSQFIKLCATTSSQMLNCTFHKQNRNKVYYIITLLLHSLCVKVSVSSSTTVNERYRLTNASVIYDTPKYWWETWIISTDQVFVEEQVQKAIQWDVTPTYLTFLK